MHAEITYEPYDFDTVVIRDCDNKIVEEFIVLKDLDIDKVIEDRLKELTLT